MKLEELPIISTNQYKRTLRKKCQVTTKKFS